MCTSPITLNKYNRVLKKAFQYTVPCGKCADCLSKKQNEVAALSVLEANAATSLFFFTFTYDDKNLPIAISEPDESGSPTFVGFTRFGDMPDSPAFTPNDVRQIDGLCYAASPCREDIKIMLKRFRSIWKRHYPDVPLDFRYLVFSELGERYGRPHFHGLFYSLTRQQAYKLRDIWKNSFGYVDCEEVRPKSDLSDYSAVSKYVSKYIAKGPYSRWAWLYPYIEKPRRQSSLGFGLKDVPIDSLLRFILERILIMGASHLDCPNLLYSASLTVKNLLPLMEAVTLFQEN